METVFHLVIAATDVIHCVIPYIAGGVVYDMNHSLLLTIGAVVAASLFCRLTLHESFDLKENVDPPFEGHYGFYKSMCLREEFGIVNAKTGGLLLWDPRKDSDFTIDRSDGRYNLHGYFVNLHKERAETFLNTIQSLQAILPANCKIPFSYPPKAETMIAFLKNIPTGLPNVTEWEQKLLKQETDMKSIWDIISKGFSLTTKQTSTKNYGSYQVKTTTIYKLPNRFPLDQDTCKKYFMLPQEGV